jgi:DNA-binding transcriptional LysR family regulator
MERSFANQAPNKESHLIHPTQELPGSALRSVAPRAKIAAYSNSVSGALSAARSGLGLAILPAVVGSPDNDLLCVWRPEPEVTEPFTLLVHPDLRRIPRVRALLDFIGEEIPTIRTLFRGGADTRA